jgi:hypothetical protein
MHANLFAWRFPAKSVVFLSLNGLPNVAGDNSLTKPRSMDYHFGGWIQVLPILNGMVKKLQCPL